MPGIEPPPPVEPPPAAAPHPVEAPHPAEAPDAGVIEDAKAIRRRERRLGALVILGISAIGVAAWLGLGGGGSGGAAGRPRPSTGGGGAAAAHPGGPGSAGVTWSADLTPNDYRLAVEHGWIAVINDPFTGAPCQTQLLDPQTLRLQSTTRGCGAPSQATPPTASWLHGGSGGAGDVVRVATRDPATGRTTMGPVLMTLANWNWSHSAVARGDGRLWIYALNSPAPASSPDRSALLELSARTGALLHRFPVDAGPDPFLVVDADGAWITQSAWGGSSCTRACTLWHVAPGSSRLVAVRRLGVRTQWLLASGHSIYADVLASVPRFGFRQTIWRLNGPRAQIAYTTRARLLPSTDFGELTGYVVVGDARHGYFTISQLGRRSTPSDIGSCDAAAPIRVVRIDPGTGRQSYVATLPRAVAGAELDCHLYPGQAVFHAGSLYVLAGEASSTPLPGYGRVVRVTP